MLLQQTVNKHDGAASKEGDSSNAHRPSAAPAHEELVARARGGDRRAFEELVSTTYDRAYTVAFHMLRSESDARDIVQDAYIRVQRGLADFQGASKFTTWLYRVVVNLCLDQLRHKKRWGQKDPEVLETIAHAGDSPEGLTSDTEIAQHLQAGLATLSETHRATFVLFEVEGLSYDDIAQATGVRIGTVMSRLYYARQKMRDFMLQHLEES